MTRTICARSSPRRQTEVRKTGATFAPQYFEFSELEPDEVTPLGTPDVVRAEPELRRGLLRGAGGRPAAAHGQPDEYMVLFPFSESRGEDHGRR